MLNAQNAVNNVKPVSVEKAQENTVDAGIEFESKVVDYGVIEHNSSFYEGGKLYTTGCVFSSTI